MVPKEATWISTSSRATRYPSRTVWSSECRRTSDRQFQILAGSSHHLKRSLRRFWAPVHLPVVVRRPKEGPMVHLLGYCSCFSIYDALWYDTVYFWYCSGMGFSPEPEEDAVDVQWRIRHTFPEYIQSIYYLPYYYVTFSLGWSTKRRMIKG